MLNYNLADILSLSRKICLPQDVVAEIPAVWANLEMAAISSHINAIVKPDTRENAYKALKDLFDDADSKGFKMLVSYLYAALHTREIYVQKGIDEDIFVDTMKCFSRQVNEHLMAFGYYGYDRGSWTVRHLSAQMFRLGILEFEICKDTSTLSVHIPSDAVMTNEALAQSYNLAKSFFANQEVEYTGIFCETWLLSPALKELLPHGSRILNFQKDYEIIKLIEGEKEVMKWVYKREYSDLNQLPETTHLQRSIKRHLLAGGSIGEAVGQYKEKEL